MEYLQTTLHNIALLLDTRLKLALASKAKIASGALLNSIQTETVKTPDGYQLNTSMAPYGQYVNNGRLPGGKKVPVSALIEWLKIKGITSGDRELKDAAFAIQLEIYRRGIPATNFIDEAFEGLDSKIEQMLTNAVNTDLQTEFEKLITS